VTRAQIFSDFSSIEPRQFQSLVKAPYRIIAPGHGSFRIDEKDGHYLDGRSIVSFRSRRSFVPR
jgi:hypothetical protein